MTNEMEHEVVDIEPQVEEEQAEQVEASETPEPASKPAAASQAPTQSNVLPVRTTSTPLSPEDERTWAMLAHLSVLLNLVTGFLGIGAALLIYLIYKDRSRYVAFQSMQAFIFQLIFWAGGGLLIGAIWAVTGALSAILIGILLIPFAIILTIVLAMFPIIALIYGVIGGIQCSEGQDFRYLLIGDWTLDLI